jgi:LacI family transcriptional regulator
MTERITTKKLAEICGVSLGTVDRALNNRYGISAKTRDTILEKAREYGYTPNHVGRSLQSGKTFDIGVIVHDLDNRFFSQLVNSIQQAAWERGFYIQLAVTLRDPAREKTILEHMLERNMDGILLFPAGKGKELDEYLDSLHKPVVTMGNRITEGGSCPLLGLNDRQVLREALTEICSRGYESFIFTAPFIESSGEINNFETEERFAGFKEVLEEQGLPWTFLRDWDYLEKMEAVLSEGKRTAVVCSSDIFALEVLKRLKERNISVPGQAGVLGFDNLDILSYVEPAMSTIAYPIKEMGREAVSLLIDSINNPGRKAGSSTIRSRIIWRDSI